MTMTHHKVTTETDPLIDDDVLEVVAPTAFLDGVEEGLQPAVFVDYEPVTGEYNGEPRPQFRCLFELEGGQRLSYWVNRTGPLREGSRKSKLYGLLTALNGGRAMPAGWKGSLRDFVGTKVRVDVREHERKDGTFTFVIKEVLPLRTRPGA